MHTRPAQRLCTGTPDMERTRSLELLTSAMARPCSTNCFMSASCEARPFQKEGRLTNH